MLLLPVGSGSCIIRRATSARLLPVVDHYQAQAPRVRVDLPPHARARTHRHGATGSDTNQRGWAPQVPVPEAHHRYGATKSPQSACQWGRGP